MAARPVWKGQLRLSLVSIPVEMFSATDRSSAVSFRQIHKPSGQPVKYEKTVPGVGPIDMSDIVKGYEVDKDDYVLIEPDEIDDIKLESKKTLELVQFVGACDIPPSTSTSPTSSPPRTNSPRTPTASCATRWPIPARPASASSPCGAGNTSWPCAPAPPA